VASGGHEDKTGSRLNGVTLLRPRGPRARRKKAKGTSPPENAGQKKIIVNKESTGVGENNHVCPSKIKGAGGGYLAKKLPIGLEC